MGQVLVVFAEIYDQKELIYRTGSSFSKVIGAGGICEGVKNFTWGLFFIVMSHESALFLPIWQNCTEKNYIAQQLPKIGYSEGYVSMKKYETKKNYENLMYPGDENALFWPFDENS